MNILIKFGIVLLAGALLSFVCKTWIPLGIAVGFIILVVLLVTWALIEQDRGR